MSIPKLIHQTGPPKDSWHPLWHRCQSSWLSNFPEFEYKFWSDSDIDNLIETKFPRFQELYFSFPVHIMKIDFVRFALMYEYGGIYADLDYYCYQNFYRDLKKSCYVVENPYGNDPIENSLMASEPGHSFWIECMELSLKRWKETPAHLIDNVKIISSDEKYGDLLRPYLVFHLTGTNLISSAFRATKKMVDTLPGAVYNNYDISYKPFYKTKHVHTGLWGKENIDTMGAKPELRNIKVVDFDFYKDYTNGTYNNIKKLDLSKNDTETQITNPGFDYDYT